MSSINGPGHLCCHKWSDQNINSPGRQTGFVGFHADSAYLPQQMPGITAAGWAQTM